MTEPSASVILCVFNREEAVAACLDSLHRQTLRDFEVVVVDDASTDGGVQGVERWSRERPDLALRIVRNPHNLGVSGSRNAGIDAARGAIVLFLDSDCTADSRWVECLTAALAVEGVTAASGPVIDDPPRNLVERAYVGTARAGGATGRRLVGGNMGFRREALETYRFDAALAYGCDEDDLAWRLTSEGHRIGSAPEAIVQHHHPLDLGGYLRKAFRQGQGSARYWYKRGTYVGRDVAALLLAAVALPFGWLHPAAFWLSGLFLAAHLGALLFNETALKRKSPATALAVLPVQLLYSVVKAASVTWTLVRILAGREPAIRKSRRTWRREHRRS